jgi:hypothetical protein
MRYTNVKKIQRDVVSNEAKDDCHAPALGSNDNKDGGLVVSGTYIF